MIIGGGGAKGMLPPPLILFGGGGSPPPCPQPPLPRPMHHMLPGYPHLRYVPLCQVGIICQSGAQRLNGFALTSAIDGMTWLPTLE